MRHVVSIFLLLIAHLAIIHGQEIASFSVSVSDDTVLLGNYFEIRYESNNLDGQMDLPEFAGCVVVSGPNQMRNMSIVNGEQHSTQVISYLLKPMKSGTLSLPPAYLVTEEKTWEIGPRDIVILPNPEDIRTDSRLPDHQGSLNLFDDWGLQKNRSPKQKKKLKETKI